MPLKKAKCEAAAQRCPDQIERKNRVFTAKRQAVCENALLFALEQPFQRSGIPAQHSGAAMRAVFALGRLEPLPHKPHGLIVRQALSCLDGALAGQGDEHGRGVVLASGQRFPEKIPRFRLLILVNINKILIPDFIYDAKKNCLPPSGERQFLRFRSKIPVTVWLPVLPHAHPG